MSGPHDVVGVGIGPFNLGLAALLDPLDEIDALFFDAEPEFSWHPGLMLPEAEVQVPFLADLVTLADPTSPHSFLAYLHARGRLYRFYFHERLHVLRREFEAYCRWVAERLPSCRFGSRVEAVTPDGDGWTVRVTGDRGRRVAEHRARRVVLGVGSVPALPPFLGGALPDGVLHSAAYLDARTRALDSTAVTVIGSGQSAAEVFADLLENGRADQRLDWFTRSAGFLPMEYSKLGLEHFSPEYTAHFHGLPQERRDAVRAGQDLLYKGISAETGARIYDLLYRLTADAPDPDVGYRARCELSDIAPLPGGGHRLRLRHLDQDVAFDHDTEVVVLATGYRPAPPPVPRLTEIARLDALGRPLVDERYRVVRADGGPPTLFVQNAELHTHGVGAPDLGLGAHRNAVIVNAICGREVYPVRERNVFQSFGAPG
ncbi:MAG: lysine N(6)-hydroxylase/L-ornithine N(5)-oxygenase family protein [Thermoleophilia bacterium]